MPQTSSQAAPAALEPVRALVNTLDIESGADAFATPADLAGWLREAGLLSVGVGATDTDLEHAIAVREALRAAMAANHDSSPVPADAVAVLADAAG